MILEIHPENPNIREMGMVEDALRNDGVVIYPTDTVYAFGWDISSPKAYDRIMQIKGKKSKQTNFSIICKDISMVSEFTLPIGNHIFKLMKRNLPVHLHLYCLPIIMYLVIINIRKKQLEFGFLTILLRRILWSD